MRKSMMAIVALSLSTLGVHEAQAQVARVFVSVNGNDANLCSNIATPCRTLGGGVTQVDADGEVIVIDSGSYAGGTIAKAVKINVPAGVVAFSGLPIVVNPGAGKVVVLRGLTIKAVTVGSGIGINHQSGRLYLENTVVDGWMDGAQSQSGAERLFVQGSVFRNNASSGLNVLGGSTAIVSIDHSFFEGNGYAGILLDGGRSRVSGTVMASNAAAGALVRNAGTEATLQRCEASSNALGLAVYASAVLRFSGTTVTLNSTTGAYNNSATLESFGNNVIRGNLADTDGVLTVALQ